MRAGSINRPGRESMYEGQHKKSRVKETPKAHAHSDLHRRVLRPSALQQPKASGGKCGETKANTVYVLCPAKTGKATAEGGQKKDKVLR